MRSLHSKGNSRAKLVALIERHHYTIHGTEYDHFGIVVAEFVAGGCLPFVPTTGGQCELLDRNDDLLCESIDDAVETIDRVPSSDGHESSLRAELPAGDEEYGQSRFHREISAIVGAAV